MILSNLLPGTPTQTFFIGKSGKIKSLRSELLKSGVAVVSMEQIHGNEIVFIDDENQVRIPGADGIFTNQPNLALEVRVADCMPILIYHEGYIGALHAGRKGTQQKILVRALEELGKRVGSLDEVKIWFGPRICQKHYQIDRETDQHYGIVEENLKQLQNQGDQRKFKYHLYRDDRCTFEEAKLSSYRGGDRNQSNFWLIYLT